MEFCRFCDLKPCRDLIDPNFGGYKLSLDSLPVYSLNLNTDVDVIQLPDSLYSYQHLKAFGNANHLQLDPWNADTVWFVSSSWTIQKATLQGRTWSQCVEQFVIPDASNRQFIPRRLNVTLHFSSESWVTVADGTGRLFLLHSGDRRTDDKWKVGYSGQPVGEDVHFTVLHSAWYPCGSAAVIHVLCVYVYANKEVDTEQDNVPLYVTKLEWLTFYSADDLMTFKVAQLRRLVGSSSPDYTGLLRNGSTLAVACERPFRFEFDSVNPVAVVENNTKAEEPKPVYSWLQEDASITVQFELPDNTTKSDVKFQLNASTIRVGLKDDDAVLSGELGGRVDVEGSSWFITDNRVLEVHLAKTESCHWPELVVGDTRGTKVFSAEQLSEISEQLDKYTSDKQGETGSESQKSAYNAQQLEECDTMPEDSSAILVFDGETHGVIQQVNTGSNQWLFNALISADKPHAICLRHDVDGFLWQPEIADSNTSPLTWQHVGTFNAFGYVQASKEQRKFSVCAPNLSFVAVADCTKHLYVYHRPKPVGTSLHNRKTGQKIGAVARQQVVSLESTDEILGCRANDMHIFVLCRRLLYAIRVAEDDVL